MLVLTRHNAQSIIIGNRLIEIKVLGIAHDSVRIGIDAPKGFSVHREEIFRQICGEKIPEKIIKPKKTQGNRTIEQPMNVGGK